jgi:hypothetical protein
MAVVIVGRIYTVNVRYPQRTEKEIAQGDFYELKKGVEMCIVGSRWLNANDMQKEYEDAWYVDNPDAYKAVEVTIKLRNKSKKRKKVSLFQFYIESDQYDWNGCDADLFAVKNGAALEVSLESEEEKEYTLPYTFLKDSYKNSAWKALSEEGFFLVEQRYPVKVKWKIATKSPVATNSDLQVDYDDYRLFAHI